MSKKDSKTECHNLGAKLVSFDGTKEKFQCLHSLWADFTSRDYWVSYKLLSMIHESYINFNQIKSLTLN